MAALVCEMCGGTLEIDTAQGIAVCEYCGTKQTVRSHGEPSKVIIRETVRETVVSSAEQGVGALLTRAFIFLEDGEFRRADSTLEEVLNRAPENAEAYVGKLLADLRLKRPEALKTCAKPFDNNKYYIKALRYASSDLRAELESYAEYAQLYGAPSRGQESAEASECRTLRNEIAAFYKKQRIKKIHAEILRLTAEKADLGMGNAKRKHALSAKAFSLAKDALTLMYQLNALPQKPQRYDTHVAAMSVLTPFCKNLSEGSIDAARAKLCTYEHGKRFLAEREALWRASAGDEITFGRFGAALGNITWEVLAAEGTRLLIMSKHPVARRPYHTACTPVTWSVCELRTWLNKTFVAEAFTAAEQAMLIEDDVFTDPTAVFDAQIPPELLPRTRRVHLLPGQASEDKVFLLSLTEMRTYLPFTGRRICTSAPPAENGTADPVPFWLRSACRNPGFEKASPLFSHPVAVTVTRSGAFGVADITGELAVRPAMWIDPYK